MVGEIYLAFEEGLVRHSRDATRPLHYTLLHYHCSVYSEQTVQEDVKRAPLPEEVLVGYSREHFAAVGRAARHAANYLAAGRREGGHFQVDSDPQPSLFRLQRELLIPPYPAHVQTERLKRERLTLN